MAEFKREFFLFFVLCLQITTTFGQPLLEVYSVVLDKSRTGDESGEVVYGTITYWNDTNPRDIPIYDVARENAQSIRSGEYLLLTGPIHPLPKTVDVIFKVILKGKSNASSSNDSGDAYLTEETFKLSRDDIPESYLDKLIFKELQLIPVGSWKMEYVFITEPVRANIKVTLMNIMGDNNEENTPGVYGNLTAGDSSHFPSVIELFRKKSNEAISVVNPENLITLLRPGVSVSLKSSLIVEANLLDYNLLSSGNNEIITNGTADFPASTTGTVVKSIYGQNGREIQVEVTWSLV